MQARHKSLATAILLGALPSAHAHSIGTDPPSQSFDSVGIFATPNSFVTLDIGGGRYREFHFGHTTPYDRGTTSGNANNPGRSRIIPFSGDFDNDGWDSLGFYNSREGRYYLSNTNRTSPVNPANGSQPSREYDDILTFAPTAPQVGHWLPVVIDLDGDGDVEPGVYDTGNHTWYLEGLAPFVWVAPSFGIPVVGDWDGDGADSIGLFDVTNGLFYLDDSTPPQNSTPTPIAFGVPGAYPVVGDWDGDGTDDLGYLNIPNKLIFRQGASTKLMPNPVLDNFLNAEVGANLVFPVAGIWDETGVALPEPFVYSAGDPVAHGFDPVGVADAIAAAAADPEINSLLVLHDDPVLGPQLVIEEYFNGYTKNISHHMMSVTKSFLSAMIGVAIQKGYISVSGVSGTQNVLQDIAIADKLGEMPDPYGVCGGGPREPEIKLWDVMRMASGYTQVNPLPEAMFDSDDWLKYVANGPSGPGCDPNWWDETKVGVLQYYGGNNQLGAEVLRRYLAGTYTDLLSFADEDFFSRIGIAPTRWDHEPSNNVIPAATGETIYYAESQMFMRPRDMVRFGELFLNDGTLNGDTLFQSDWVSTTTADQISGDRAYGCWWWRETWDKTPLPNTYNARGYAGQHIFVIPPKNMVVVITADWLVQTPASNQQMLDNEAVLQAVMAATN